MIKRKLASLFMAVLLGVAAVAVPACSSSGGDYFRLEAEKAIAQPAYDGTVAVECRPNSKSENITSNGKYVGKLEEGNTITWFFQADRAFNAQMTLSVANAEPDSAGFTAGGGKGFSFELNGSAVNFSSFSVSAGTAYGDGWQTVNLGTLPLKQGINVAVYTVLGGGGSLNVDYLSVETKRGRVEEHNHVWKISSEPATCEEDGKTFKTCEDCGFTYYSERIAPLGHTYGNYHYDNETGKMVSECTRCGDVRTATTPTSSYFGEVYNAPDEYTTRPVALVYEAEDAYVCDEAGLNNASATSYIEKDNGNMNSPSGGKSVGNISLVGNYIRFTVNSSADCKADLVFRMANVLYTSSGIGELDPMSNYVYCNINDEAVDFTFVSFPGNSSYSYYDWRYVVVKNVSLVAGDNVIEIGPQDNKQSVTMPNTDVLYVYTDEPVLRAVKSYAVNDVARVDNYSPAGEGVRFAQTAEDEFTFTAGRAAEAADYVLTLSAEEDIDVLASVLSGRVNDNAVNFEKIALQKGNNTVVLYGVPVAALENVFEFTATGGVEVLSVEAYAAEGIVAAPVAVIDSAYDYLANRGAEGAPVPALVLEAEKADFGESVSSRTGIDLVELNIMENSGKEASGNSCVGNFSVTGNTATWRFTSGSAESADITLMLASANFSSAVNGNTSTNELGQYIRIWVNGVALDIAEINLPVDSIANYYYWQALTVKGITLNEGENTVVLEVVGKIAPNMDVLYVYSNAALSAEESGG